MKDSQQMSVDISSQNDMALQALPPVSLKESNIYHVGSLVEDDLPGDDFDLHLSDVEDENGETKEEPVVESASSDIPQESEDDILNKFDTPESEESAKIACAETDDKLEEQLLNDCIDGKEEAEEFVNGDVGSKTVEGQSSPNDEAVKEEEVKMEDGTEENEKKKEDAEKEKVNAELLKDQIMDTEHLLQIVDQQDTGEPNDNSCSGETTPDKEESDEGETEIDKNEEEEEGNQTSKADEDGVDIDEGSPYKTDFDSEVDKEYEKIVNEKNGEEESEEKVEDEALVPEKIDENAVAQEEKLDDVEKDIELAMDVSQTSTNDDQVDETVNETEIKNESKDKQEPPDPTPTTKRSLSEPDTTVEAKRLRLEETDSVSEDIELNVDNKESETIVKPSTQVIALNAISEYMQKKTLKKLTREDLEQICLMKMCEAICHKSEIGELRHQLSVQEQMIDMWRKEAAQLTKQARDLEIVNKRLLHEVRLRNDKDKPLIPVKITRSVGLQVRSDNNVMYNPLAQKRRFARPQQPATAPTNTTPKQQPQQQNRFNQTKQITSSINKTPTSKPVQTSPATKLSTPLKTKPVTQKTNSLLSKALQNSTAQAANSSSTNTVTTNTVTPPPLISVTNSTTTPVTTKSLTNVSPKTIKPAESKGVIDLTDEDEKKPTSSSTNTSTVNTTQGVRIVSTPVKNTNTVSSASVVNPPRIMYLYNNQLHQGVLATDSSKVGSQKVMFKLNSNVIGQPNGVITTVTNGTPVAVSNGAVRTNQVQSVRFSSPATTVRTSASSKAILKHPAPLPPPPLTQMNLAARKPIPPKPHLSIRRSSGGIVLSWKMPYNLDNFEAIASYQLYAYQETTSAPSSDMWRKVGDVKALALPMACTLTQFADGNKYHFAVRAVDVQKRMGPFSDPEQILL